MSTSILARTLLGFALVASASAQTKVQRPLPSTPPDKPAIEPLPQALPAPRPMPTGRVAANKPLPAGAPSLATVGHARPDLMIDEPGDGRVWVRGADYKASFGSEGATFIPFLGSDAPQNYPVRMSVVSARVGDRDIALTPAGTMSRAGQRITIERGGLSEVYDVSRDGIEQTFVLDSLPVRGALHVEVAIESDLVARDVDGGLELSNERGGVRCGSTVVLDAAGARFETPTRLVAGRMQVDVPEAFVRSAQLPLRVDPVWTTYQIITTTPDQYFSDVAYDLSWGNWCIVYEEVYSLNDHDVYATMVYSNQLVPNSTTSIDYTTDFWREPKVANNSLADNFLVVATAFPVGGGQSEIRGRIRAAGTNVMGVQTTLSGSEIGAKVNADVGGDPLLSGPTYYLVVYQRSYDFDDSDVHARLVNPDGTPAGGTIHIENSSATLDGMPRVSKSDGNAPSTTQAWNVVWQRTDYFAANIGDVWGAQLHWDGYITTPAFLIEGGVADDKMPVASPPLERTNGTVRPWMVAFERDMSGHHDLVGAVLEGGVVQATANLTALEGIVAGEDQLAPELECDGVQFVMAFRESYQGNLQDYDIYASAFWFADHTIGVSEGHASLDYSSQNSHLPRIASQNSGAFVFGGAFVSTWTTLAASGNFDIHAGQYFAPGNGPERGYCFGDGSGTACPCSAGSFGNGCANSVNAAGANLSGTGFHRAIVDTFVLTASGMPANASCLFFQGTTQPNGGLGAAFGDGLRCVGGSVIRFDPKTAQGGIATYPEANDPTISAQGGITAAGAIRNYQAWYRNADTGFCTPSTFNLTNGYEVVWLP